MSENFRPPKDGNELPLLPLRESVVYPHMVIPLFVGRRKSLEAVERAMQSNKEIVVAAQRNGAIDDPAPEDIYDMGTVCQIMQMLRLPDGIIRILVEGMYRAKIEKYTSETPCYEVLVQEAPPESEALVSDPAALKRQQEELLELLRRYIKLNPKMTVELFNLVAHEHPGRMTDIIASNLPVRVQDKQAVLEKWNLNERMELVASLLKREIEILGEERRLRGKTRKYKKGEYKEEYLKEQMRKLQKELGERDSFQAELEDYEKRIEEAGLPGHAREKCEQELKKLARMSPMSAEAGVIRTYLDTMLDLPWNVSTKDKHNVLKAARILDEDHYGLDQPKERILEFLSVCKLKKTIKGPIICFLGPPGVGKTSLARSIARAMGRRFVRISLGGMHDEAEIRGHRRTYVGAMPGKIIQMLQKAGTNNPVFLLDEIDKTGTDFKGDPASALLEVLDPEQNSTFTDHYLGVPFDLSNVLFITTANVPHTIPAPLLDRMEIIQLPGYTQEEKVEIAKGFLIPKQLEENGLKRRHLDFLDTAIVHIIRRYTREAGVRELERKIGAICRKVAKKRVSEGLRGKEKITVKAVERYLGIPQYHTSTVEEKDQVGLAIGLSWTQIGGNILPIEVVTMPGSGKLLLTGQLGNVMKESARAALSYTRKHAEEFGMDPEFHRKFDLHVHAPEAAMPKEGPSAGLTIAIALISALTKKPVSHEVAMSGEITLTGKVLPVGGIKEKILAAYRLDIPEVILCKENEKNLEDIPSRIKRRLTFHFVETIAEALPFALKDFKR